MNGPRASQPQHSARPDFHPAPSGPCPHLPSTLQLADQKLSGEQRSGAQRHLQHCADCREQFRASTAGRFPVVPQYTIVEHLGRGGFGAVYKAVHHAKQRIEALKIGSTSAGKSGYLANEVHLSAQLRHPNIATLFEAQLDADPPYFAMELVDGDEFDTFVQQHRLPLRHALELILRIVEAVAYAHERGVIHRDIKPQNILVTPDGEPHIVDFGVGKSLEARGPTAPQPESPAGTLGYMAPEQVWGHGSDARSDIFSLGVLLFHVLTGGTAQQLARPTELRQQFAQRGLRRSEDLAAIVGGCTDDDPARRYSNCRLLADDLRQFLAGGPIHARCHASWLYRLNRGVAYAVQNHPVAISTALSIAMSLLLTLGSWYAQARSAAPDANAGDSVVVVGFDAPTIEAMNTGQFEAIDPAVRSEDRRSWRRLYGRACERLGAAGARAVALDYFFSACAPLHDDRFVQSLQRCAVPVIGGARDFDENSDPVACPTLVPAFRAFGLLAGVRPRLGIKDRPTPLLIQRGFAPPRPTLALAAFAAARRPDCDATYAVVGNRVEIRYARRETAAGQHRFESPDTLAIADSDTNAPVSAGLAAGDRVFHARTATAPLKKHWVPRVSLAEVLTTDDVSLRRRFGGRIALLGQMLPPDDLWHFEGGSVFGCEVQAAQIAALMEFALPTRAQPLPLFGRFAIGTACGGLALGALWWRRPSVPRLALALSGIGLCTLLPAVVFSANLRLSDTLSPAMPLLTGAIGGAAVLTLMLGARNRQLALEPSAVGSASGTTLSSRLVVETGSTRTRAHATPGGAVRP